MGLVASRRKRAFDPFRGRLGPHRSVCHCHVVRMCRNNRWLGFSSIYIIRCVKGFANRQLCDIDFNCLSRQSENGRDVTPAPVFASARLSRLLWALCQPTRIWCRQAPPPPMRILPTIRCFKEALKSNKGFHRVFGLKSAFVREKWFFKFSS